MESGMATAAIPRVASNSFFPGSKMRLISPNCITMSCFLRRPRRFPAAKVRRTKDQSPARKHWEQWEIQTSPGTGLKNPRDQTRGSARAEIDHTVKPHGGPPPVAGRKSSRVYRRHTGEI